MDIIFITLILSILIGIVIAILLLLLLTKKSTTSSTPEPSILTIDCSNIQTPRNLNLPSSFPFLLQTNGLGAGAFSLAYYSDPNYTTPNGGDIENTQIGPIEINPQAGTQSIQYIFLCDKIPTPFPLTVNTPDPIPINPKLPYFFKNDNEIQNMTVSLTDLADNITTLSAIAPSATAVPNPAAGYQDYSVTFA